MWIIWALLSAFFAATRRTNQKRIAGKLNHFTIGLGVQLFSLPVATAVLLYYGNLINPLSLGRNFWLPLLVVSFVFYPLNTFLSVQAIKNDELSKVLPLQSLWPVFSLLPAWLTFHEIPSSIATTGIALTVTGVYVLGLKGRALHHPLQPFKEERGSRYMLFGVMLVTAAAVLDKIAIQASDAVYYSFASTLGAVIALSITYIIYRVDEMKAMRKNLRELSLIGTFQGVSYLTYLLAIGAGPIAYVTSIRGSNVLMGSLLGIVLLKERLTRPKIASFFLITVGSILLAIGSRT
jgi:uncharacterized membrane protein